MRIKAMTGAGLLLLASLAAGPAASAGVRIIVAVGPPPPPRIEYVARIPHRNVIWVPGHWVARGGWVWIPGYWVRRPCRDTHWMAGRWTPHGRAWVWRAGYRGRRGHNERDRDPGKY